MAKKSIWDQLDAYQEKYGDDAVASPEKKKKKKRKRSRGLLDSATRKMSGRDTQISEAMARAMKKPKKK